MMATEYEMNIDQGSDYHLIIDVVSDWLPEDLTGFTTAWKVRALKTDIDVLANLSAYATVDTANRQVDILVPAAVSSAWGWTKGLYDIEITNGVATGRILQGTITVDQEVTR